MIRPVAILRWCGGLAFIAAAAALAPSPAAADSFAFSYGSGHYRPYHHHPYWGPRYHSSLVVVSPPPVYYAPPPPVYYVPPPPVYYAPPPVVSPMVDATPASAPYRTSDGRYCREYTTTTVVAGVPRSSYGTACLQPDGSWRIVN
ncbi:MAG: hypothetical protein ACM30I_02785 [Gemmatimonas sp.]